MKDIYLKVSLNIVFIFMVLVAVSFVTDNLHDQLGDNFCEGAKYVKTADGFHLEGCLYGDTGDHMPTWHWGYRHWLVFFMGVLLFITSIVRVINLIIKEDERHHPHPR